MAEMVSIFREYENQTARVRETSRAYTEAVQALNAAAVKAR